MLTETVEAAARVLHRTIVGMAQLGMITIDAPEGIGFETGLAHALNTAGLLADNELISRIDDVRNIHEPMPACCNPDHTTPDTTCPDCVVACLVCEWDYPCPTVRAIDGMP